MAQVTLQKDDSRKALVKKLQRALIATGYSVGSAGADGDYGGDTAKAVMTFQTARDLPPTGTADPKTIEALGLDPQTLEDLITIDPPGGGQPIVATPTKRGVVLPMTADQRVQRARYLASDECAAGYYLLKEHNGGKDPTAVDPFDRWSKPGSDFVNRTADCIGGAAWCGGFDRYQTVRFAHLYKGWINTDSMLLDARGKSLCFTELEGPEPGCFVVCASGSRGHKVGHIGTVVDVPAEWNPKERECWDALGVVDVASTGAGVRANTLRTGKGWFDTKAGFIVSKMQP